MNSGVYPVSPTVRDTEKIAQTQTWPGVSFPNARGSTSSDIGKDYSTEG